MLNVFFDNFLLLCVLLADLFLLLLRTLRKVALIELLDARLNVFRWPFLLYLLDLNQVVVMVVDCFTSLADGKAFTLGTFVSDPDDGAGRTYHAGIVLMD